MATISNPWVAKSNTYKGQLHCHSNNSDGVDTPANLVTAYKNAGYNFVCLTDHNKVTADPSVAGILFIPGCEETADNGHIGAVNVSANSTNSGNNEVIRDIVADGGVACINHPNWANNLWYDVDILGMVGFKLFEVFNQQVAPNQNADTKYDNCLSTPNKPTWCVAVDDCHNIAGAAFNVGWIVVNADELTVSAIMAQIAAGNFYASTGAVISNIALSGNQITVTTDASSSIQWRKKNGAVIKTTTGATSDSYTTSAADGYVRVIITRDSDSKQAWSQPLYWTDTAGVDDEFTKLLLHCDGADSGTIIKDEAGKTVGVYGGCSTKASWKKFGTASAYIARKYTGYLVLADHEDFDFGAGNFTVDCWIRPGSVANETHIFGHHRRGVYDGCGMFIKSGGYLYFYATTNGSSFNVTLTSLTALQVDNEYHVAVVRDGDTWGLYVNGVLEAGAIVSGAMTDSTSLFYVGAGVWGNLGYYNGYIDEFRVSKGIARWTIDVAVPTSEAVYDSTNDKLLLLMNGTDGQQVFTDEAGKTVTVAGQTYTEADIRKFGNASGYFDGSGDYLSLADSADFEFGSGEFCIDFWVYPSSVATNKSLFCKHASRVYDEYYCYFSGTGIIRFYASSNGSSWDIALTSAVAITTNAWSHIAILRLGNWFYMLINGQVAAVTYSSGTIGTGTNALWIGHHNSYYYQGYVDDFRIAKGISRYDIGLTVPTEQYGESEPEPDPPTSEGIFFAIVI